MKKLIAKRKGTGISKPLLKKQVDVVRKFRINQNSPERIQQIFEEISRCNLSWVRVNTPVNVPPGESFESFYMRKDIVTPLSVTGKRIFIPPDKPSGYATVSFRNIHSNVCVQPFTPDKSGDVVIVCISGRGGGVAGPNGMTRLQDTLRTRLTSAYGVNPANIFHRSWNKNRDSDPSGAPLLNDLLGEINKRSMKPSYLAIIGHSYGGWAACKVSRNTSKIPNFIGLIDPVFGSSNTFTSGNAPRGATINNWYQKNGVIGGEPCTGLGKIPCVPAINGISCGNQSVTGARPILVNFLKTWDGKIKTVNCLGKGSVRLIASHTDIDDDKWIHHLIFNQINNDLSKIIKK
ncbi:hypothetical protein QFZ81_003922 [Paenibacillus sp. V4I9]|uniref:hypothetical protein n=1 Tax=Paenibacillus sp. V4I9 TaxID=3042308 RepID=UPI00277E4738|nr:hypothetical protein [Paenibacillus sp. V4I9]MDQ0888834.1 hypothetical protein [Paenibacillus sp. V4I9]